jgi:hypothetical protein
MVKNKEFEYCSWNQNEWGWNFQNVWNRPLWYAFLRHLESYYCILRWKNWIRGSFKKKIWRGKKLSRWRPQWVGRVTGTTPIFLFGFTWVNGEGGLGCWAVAGCTSCGPLSIPSRPQFVARRSATLLNMARAELQILVKMFYSNIKKLVIKWIWSYLSKFLIFLAQSEIQSVECGIIIANSHPKRQKSHYTYVVSDICIPRPDTTARSPDSTGKILLVFYEIYRVGDSECCRINFARKGILVCEF